ncbi:major facilitator superfamily domain-containing protein [Truncatella angustata]|uniref:Major facilitator superfamily domain-containing protein n=1 Tax=Truncatella angustata TaxID=152316 RepID=A0A9P8UJD4_9PEZI|nr:major facilitator superfamily domain-containing protein [Truncatella angustata]KAH6653212.1 major facilitator superfamily domain-containing protein [Truncatella angustata]
MAAEKRTTAGILGAKTEPSSRPATRSSRTVNPKANGTETGIPVQQAEEAPYTVLTLSQKRLMVFCISIIGLVSPLTGSIYLPAMNDIAADLGVRVSLVNLTITTYQIFQGLAPSFIASLADTRGRRPAYLVALGIYVAANLALALQWSYPALMVLRCLQSAGSSATIALAGGVVSDMVTRAERGSYIGWSSLGISLGPALGPVFGGLLAGYAGWRSIFWFLMALGGVLLVVVACLMPETCRAVVGNGSVRPQKWNLSLVQWLNVRSGATQIEERTETITKPRKRPNPLSALKILFEPEGGITLGFGALLFAGYFMVMTTLSEQLASRFGFDSIKIGLCYLPLGFGSLISRWTAGQLFDWNFRRHARKLGIELDMSKQQQIEVFPIERIRLEICIPMVYISCGTVLAYAWTMNSNTSLAGIEVVLFFQGLFFSGALQGMNTLIVDTHQDTPATASAANNLFRCLFSAGGTAVAPLMIEKIGVGWMGVFISGVWLVFSPCLWLVLFKGKSWREEERKRREAKDAEKKDLESNA